MVQFIEKIHPGDELIGPKLFPPEAYASSKLCEFIMYALYGTALMMLYFADTMQIRF